MPAWLALGHRECPGEQIADVGEDLDGRTRIVAGLEIDVGLRSVAEYFSASIRDRGQGMPEHVTGGGAFGGLHFEIG